MWSLAIFAWTDILSRYLFGGTEVNHEVPQTLQCFSRSALNPVAPVYEADVLPLCPEFWFHQASGAQRALSTPVAKRSPENLQSAEIFLYRSYGLDTVLLTEYSILKSSPEMWDELQYYLLG